MPKNVTIKIYTKTSKSTDGKYLAEWPSVTINQKIVGLAFDFIEGENSRPDKVYVKTVMFDKSKNDTKHDYKSLVDQGGDDSKIRKAFLT